MRKLICIFPVVSACATGMPIPKKVVLEQSTESKPEWVSHSKVSWEKDSRVYYKSKNTIRGNERVSGCFDLARLNSKEVLVSEVSNEIKGSIDHAQTTLSEGTEMLLGRTITSEFEGKLKGLRVTEEYSERYLIGTTERVDCYTLSSISLSDYNQFKLGVVAQLEKIDPRLKEALIQKQAGIIAGKSDKTETTIVQINREPSSQATVDIKKAE